MLRIGGVTLRSNLLLAPIAGYCDLAFRLVVRACDMQLDDATGNGAAVGAGVGNDMYGGFRGVGLTCTDLLCPQALLSENDKSLWLAATSPEDQPICMQLYGADADILAEAARWAEAHGATTIDINMGCPVDKVTKKNGGSMLLCDPANTLRLAKKIVDAVDVPVTAKIRLGWDDTQLITDTLPAQLVDQGICMVTVHGRTTEQKFRGHARLTPTHPSGLDAISVVVESVKRHHPTIPVIGNGDVKTPEDAARMIDVTGCDGVMIGRGALGKPWLFRETAHYLATGEKLPPMSRADRARLVVQHFDLLHQYRNERVALNLIRQRMSWYSAGLQPWQGLRHDVRSITSAEEFHDFMAAGIERHLANEPEPTPIG